MIKDLIVKNIVTKALSPSSSSSASTTGEKNEQLRANSLLAILENLPAIKEFYIEYREGIRIEQDHERAMREIETQHTKWLVVVQKRGNEREKIQDSFQREIEKTDDMSNKMELYKMWLEVLKCPLVDERDFL